MRPFWHLYLRSSNSILVSFIPLSVDKLSNMLYVTSPCHWFATQLPVHLEYTQRYGRFKAGPIFIFAFPSAWRNLPFLRYYGATTTSAQVVHWSIYLCEYDCSLFGRIDRNCKLLFNYYRHGHHWCYSERWFWRYWADCCGKKFWYLSRNYK